ncbi:hypothetical protein [Salinilacihabitans rarus]|uniref:hypothetical protein n=1 Tax=Salinilacihabitans rarus TaxID=2961596 RepID=UPI0020C91CEB|nr:hypothetical protein [Salinilacihabitans rarus]
MSDRRLSIPDRVRKPEYTGENRCVPCTVVNVLIALAASVLVGVLAAVELGALVLACSLLAIYLRGYLVPGTPALTERYLPDRVLAWFDEDPFEDDAHTWETLEKLEAERENAVDPEAFLREAGAVEPREEADAAGHEFRLADDFAALVERRAEPYRDGSVPREAIAAVFGVAPGEVTDEDRDYPAVEIGRRIRKWPSDAALVADVAAHEALRERTDRWAAVPTEQRVEMLTSLRSYRERCPLCAGELAFSEDTVASCCRTYEVVSYGCPDCDAPMRELDPATAGLGEPRRGVHA